MKKYVLLLALMLVGISVFGQNLQLEQLFDKYQDTPGVTSIKIGKPMFNLVRGMNIQDEEFNKMKPLLRNVNSLSILIMEADNVSGADTIAGARKFSDMRDDMLSALSKLKYSEVLSVNNDEDKIKFLAQDATSDILTNLVITINGDDQNLLILLDGEVSMKDIETIANK